MGAMREVRRLCTPREIRGRSQTTMNERMREMPTCSTGVGSGVPLAGRMAEEGMKGGAQLQHRGGKWGVLGWGDERGAAWCIGCGSSGAGGHGMA